MVKNYPPLTNPLKEIMEKPKVMADKEEHKKIAAPERVRPVKTEAEKNEKRERKKKFRKKKSDRHRKGRH